jgi:hypothetical protein
MMAGVLVFLLVGGGSVFAKAEKPGAMLVVQKKGGQTIEGELLKVWDGTLEILVRESAVKVLLPLHEISWLRIEKKSTFFKSFLNGLMTGGAVGALLGFMSGNSEPGFMSWTAGEKALGLGIFLGGCGGAVGGIIGAVRGIDESIELDMLAPKKLVLVEAKLASRARFRSLLPAKPPIAPLPEPASPQAGGVPNQVSPTTVPDEAPRVMPPPRKRFSRWHFSFLRGLFYAKGADELSESIEKAGFGDDLTYRSISFFGVSGTMRTVFYPSKDDCSRFSLKDIRLEYSLTRKLALGLVYSPLGAHTIWGWRAVDREKHYGDLDEYGPHFGGRYRGNAYYLTAAFMPLPDTFIRKSMLKLGAGVGVASIKGAFLSALEIPYAENQESSPELKVDKLEFRRGGPALLAFIENDYFIGRHLSFGLAVNYKYVPFRNKAGRLEIPYVHTPSKILEVIPVDVPRVGMNAGGFSAGISLGIHF